MGDAIKFDREMIKCYDTTGPRYTSYPTAVVFTSDFTQTDYKKQVQQSNQTSSAAPLSLYFHIPFCDTICFYCACNKIATKDYSKADAYLKYLYREIELQGELFDFSRQVEQLHFGGGTPTFLTAQQISDLMVKIGQHFNLLDTDEGDYSIEIDPRSVTKETIYALRKAGFNRFSLGVQDIDEKVQRAVNRIQPVSQTRAIIDACREAKAHSISIDLIYGLPFQTSQRFMKTLDEVIRISPDRMSVFNYAHLPTRFKPQRRINEQDLPDSDTKLDILGLAVKKLTEAGYVYIGMDHFAKPNDELALAQSKGTLHRNFQGYTTHANCDLVGMGVSSISSVKDCYAQNAKTLDTYYQAIGQNQLATIKGLTLNEDDKLRRKIIQQLSCHFCLDFATIATQYSINFTDYFAQELNTLASMATDKLLTINEQGLAVTPKGRFLIRNICMVFDVSLREKSVQQRFSKVI